MRIILLVSLLNLTLIFSQQVTVVPSPNPSSIFNNIRGISGTSDNNIWAVGTYDESANYDFKNLVLRWNGSSWNQMTVPNPDNDPDLFAVSALNENLAWAVGLYADAGSQAQMQILKWNGSNWSLENTPPSTSGSFLWDVEAVSANNVWAAGGQGPDPQNLASVPLIMRWNGSDWSRLYVPPVGARRNRFNAFDHVSDNNVWAVGSWGDVLGQYKFLIQHWNGSSWSHIQTPASNLNGELEDIIVISPNDIWALGWYISGEALYMHWNGTSWSIVDSPGSSGALIALSSNNIYSVGSNIAKWNGSTWQVVDDLNQLYGPSLVSATLLPSGEIWAGGRFLDANDHLMTLTVKFPGTLITGVESGNNDPLSFQLKQNYPNPFNPVTIIDYNIVVAGNVYISIYDITGKAVSTLVDKKQNIGTYQVQFNGDGLNSGIYFYTMSIDGNIIGTKKMTLIK